MFDSILKVFGLDYESKLEKERQQYLAQLSPPSSKIVIGSHKYDPECFNCEIVVKTKDLLIWLEDHLSERSVSLDASVFLERLPKANLSDDRLTYLSPGLYNVIKGYEERLIEKGQANVVCGVCNQTYKEIVWDRKNHKDEGHWHSGTILWQCPAGDTIYKKSYNYYAH